MESIYAVDEENGLCKDGKIPWYSKKDLRFFMEKTKNNIIIMGKNTYLSLPKGPLKDRLNIVLTKTPTNLISNLFENFTNLLITSDDKIHEFILNNREKYLNEYSFLSRDFKIIFIGGKQIYEQFIPLCKIVWVTYIKKNMNAIYS